MFTNILVPTDGSASALTAARLGEALVAPGGTLTLLHVSNPPMTTAAAIDALAGIIGGVPGDLHDQEALSSSVEGTRILADTHANLTGQAKVRTEERLGRPAAVILNQLEAGGYDLAVLGERGRGPVARALLGSVSHSVLQNGRKAVAIARQPQIRSILVGIDGSEASLRAARLGAELAGRHGASLSLLLVAEVGWIAPPEARQAEAANVHARAQQLLAEMAPEIAAARRVTVGNPPEQMLAEAQSLKADLILLGRSGRTAHPRVGLGSVVTQVAFHAEASVLVVP